MSQHYISIDIEVWKTLKLTLTLVDDCPKNFDIIDIDIEVKETIDIDIEGYFKTIDSSIKSQ